MPASKIQTILWWLLFAAYFASKYFVGGFTGFSWPYLFSVCILTALTGIVPWYVSKWITSKLSGGIFVIGGLLLPVILTTVGLSTFFIGFIAPNYPTIELAGIIHRAILPGAGITVLLFIPVVIEQLRGERTQEESNT